MSVFAFGVAGCGGDEGSSGSDAVVETESTGTDTGATESESADAGSSDPSAEGATFDDALACLQDEGVDAKDQSSNVSGGTIGIDYSGGRTTISFEKTAEDAEITAMVAGDYGEVIQVGNVIAVIDPSADTADTEVIKSCIAA